MSVASAVRDLLHDRGPLTLDELVALTVEQGTVVSKKPKQTIRTALLYQPMIEPGADTSYVYFSRFIAGAFVRMPMDRARPGDGLLAIPPEASALLWPEDAYGARGKTPKLSLEGGPTIRVKSKYRQPDQLQTFVRVPEEFWRWWAEQPEVGALLLCCVDGEAGKFTARALIEDEAQREEAVARDTEIRKAAAAIMHRARTIQIVGLARRLLARGIYHHGPAPGPLADVLFQPGSPFIWGFHGIAYRPDITPAMQRLFRHRLAAGLAEGRALMHMDRNLVSGGADHDELEALGDEVDEWGDEVGPRPEPLPFPVGAEQQGYRLRVGLRWKPTVWREVEIRGDHTLWDLHSIIQHAFGWDNDHLHAFYLSGKRNDTLTEVGAYSSFGGHGSPFSREVALAHLELKRGQKLLYLFDFGDNLEHDIQYLGPFTPERDTTYPRVTEVHGKAPAQYRNWEE